MNNKLKKIKFWSGFLCVFPFSMFLLMSVLWSNNYMDIMFTKKLYKKGLLTITKIESIPNGSGSPAIYVEGNVESLTTSFLLGIEGEQELRINKNKLLGDSLVYVWYKPNGKNTLQVMGKYSSFLDLFYKKIIWNFLFQVGGLAFPFVISFGIYIFLTIKLRNKNP